MNRRNVSLWLGGGFIVVLLLLSLSAPLWYPHDPYYFEIFDLKKMERTPYPPSADMPLGSDGTGRDLLSRLIVGFQWTFLFMLLMTLGKYVLALPLGFWAGVKGKWMGKLTETWSLYVSGFPALLVMIIVFHLPFINQGFWTRIFLMIGVVALLEWARIGLSVKGQVEHVMKSPFIDAAKVMGRNRLGIIIHHVWPVLRAETISQFVFECSRSLMVIGQLAIFGLYFMESQLVEIDNFSEREVGLQPEWGSMLGESRDYMLIEPIIPFFIAALIVLTILAFNLLGEGLRRDLNIPATVKQQRHWQWRLGPLLLSMNARKLVLSISGVLVVFLISWKMVQFSPNDIPEPDRESDLVSAAGMAGEVQEQDALSGTEAGAKLVKETAEQFTELGLKPLDGRDILEEVSFSEEKINTEETYLTVHTATGDTAFSYGQDFLEIPHMALDGDRQIEGQWVVMGMDAADDAEFETLWDDLDRVLEEGQYEQPIVALPAVESMMYHQLMLPIAEIEAKKLQEKYGVETFLLIPKNEPLYPFVLQELSEYVGEGFPGLYMLTEAGAAKFEGVTTGDPFVFKQVIEQGEQTYQLLAAEIVGKDDSLEPVMFFETLEEQEDDTVVRNIEQVARRLAEEQPNRTIQFVLLEGGLATYLQQEDNMLTDQDIIFRMLPYTFQSLPDSIGNQLLPAHFTRVSGYHKRSIVEEAVTQSAWRLGHVPDLHRGDTVGLFRSRTIG